MHERRDELERNFRSLIQANPQLAQLLRERNLLEVRYKAARKARFTRQQH